MIQSPCVQPVQPVQQYPQQGYSANAVKIDIINPMAGGPGVGAQSQNMQMCPQPGYANPTAPIYQYPQAPVYTYPQQPGQPYYPPAAPQQVNVNAPGQAPTAPAEVPAPQVSNPDVVQPVPVKPAMDMNAFLARLTNPDFATQRAAMEEISQIIKEDQANGTNRSDVLFDNPVFDALIGIMNTDSSKQEGPSQAQLDARKKKDEGKELTEEDKTLAEALTPMEECERNKCYAMYSIALIAKHGLDELQKANKSLSLTAIPGVVEIVENLKNNQNPLVRLAAIEALSFVQRPEYSKDLRTLFEVAKKDEDPDVAEAADKALAKLDEMNK